MNKQLILFCSALLLSMQTFATRTDYTSRSFMFYRPINQNIAMNQALWHDVIYTKRGENLSGFQMYAAYQNSLEQIGTARYFLIDPCKDCVLITGDNASCNKIRDVRAEWLGITNAKFLGTLKIAPEQRQIGLFLEYHKDLREMFETEFLRDYWVSLNLPIVIVENDLNMQQVNVLNSNQNSFDIIEALTNPKLRYGKFYRCSRRKTGAAELNIRFGKAYLAHNDFEVIYYSGFRIPMGGSQNPEFLFDPYIGNNGHFGMVTGVNFQIKLNHDNDNHVFSFFTSLESTFLARSEQTRTFDLKNKPWSRYLLLNHQDGPPDQLCPATQVLTLKVRARPYTVIDFVAGLRLKTNWFETEIGYSLWGRGEERVRILCNFKEEWGIAGTTDPENPSTVASASESTIKTLAANDDEFVVICKSDIDLKSGAAQSSLNHRLHLSIGFINKGTTVDGFFGFGGFYEIPQKNTAFKLWGAWAKFGATF